MYPKISFLLVNSVKEIEEKDMVNLLSEQLEPLIFQMRVAVFNLLFRNSPGSCCPPNCVQALPGRGMEAVSGRSLAITQSKLDCQLCALFSLIV